MYKATLKTTLIALATVASVGTAFANNVPQFEFINNAQINLEDVFSEVQITVDGIAGLTDISSSALGNNFIISAENAGPLNVDTSQVSRADNIISRVNLTAVSTPIVKIVSEAIANKTIIISKGAGGNVINNVQTSAGAPPPPPPPVPTPRPRPDPLSEINITVDSIDDLTIDSRAGGNFAQFVLEGTGNSVTSAQTNSVMNVSRLNIDVLNITNDLDINSSAWGNSLVIVLGDIPEAKTD